MEEGQSKPAGDGNAGPVLQKMLKGDQMWQQQVDADGNWLRQTDGKIQDKAIEREAEALGNTETVPSHTKTVDDHWTESVGGFKKIGLDGPHLKKLKPTQLSMKNH